MTKVPKPTPTDLQTAGTVRRTAYGAWLVTLFTRGSYGNAYSAAGSLVKAQGALKGIAEEHGFVGPWRWHTDWYGSNLYVLEASLPDNQPDPTRSKGAHAHEPRQDHP
jgi:hypothetical protein